MTPPGNKFKLLSTHDATIFEMMDSKQHKLKDEYIGCDYTFVFKDTTSNRLVGSHSDYDVILCND